MVRSERASRWRYLGCIDTPPDQGLLPVCADDLGEHAVTRGRILPPRVEARRRSHARYGWAPGLPTPGGHRWHVRFGSVGAREVSRGAVDAPTGRREHRCVRRARAPPSFAGGNDTRGSERSARSVACVPDSGRVGSIDAPCRPVIRALDHRWPSDSCGWLLRRRQVPVESACRACERSGERQVRCCAAVCGHERKEGPGVLLRWPRRRTDRGAGQHARPQGDRAHLVVLLQGQVG